jgi:type I site-specific restriction endonuclease
MHLSLREIFICTFKSGFAAGVPHLYLIILYELHLKLENKRVLEAILDKYADEDVEHIEDIGILRIQPFNDLGTPVQIISEFGGKDQYLKAVKELEEHIYNPYLTS